MRTRSLAIPAALLTAALTLAGCGSNSPNSASTGSSASPTHDMSTMGGMDTATTSPTPGTPAAGAHNDADVSFATGMIPHHAQAVTMADMAAKKATNAEVKKLATAIKAAQSPEITQMSGWLKGWGQPVPDTTSSMGGMDMGNGMMTDADMKKLDAASGAAFDRMWLQMMIKHHQGAVTMATTELTAGSNADAKMLAQNIITSQKTEITQMQKLEPTVG